VYPELISESILSKENRGLIKQFFDDCMKIFSYEQKAAPPEFEVLLSN